MGSYSTDGKIAILETRNGIDLETFSSHLDAFEACARRALAMLNADDAERTMQALMDRLTRVCQNRRREDEEDRRMDHDFVEGEDVLDNGVDAETQPSGRCVTCGKTAIFHPAHRR